SQRPPTPPTVPRLRRSLSASDGVLAHTEQRFTQNDSSHSDASHVTDSLDQMMYLRRNDTTPLAPDEYDVEMLLDCRKIEDGTYEYLTR
ncbi:hypothetical protein SLS56_001830, partial [Neofusicoccum ribis]